MNRLLKKAFTLIELLVVIAIIGILSGLIIVSMGGMTQKATIAKAQVFSNSLRNSLMMNIVSEWKFDEGSGATAIDTWKGDNGTINGASYLTGSSCIYGSCLSFNGSSNYISLSAGGGVANIFTISIWFNSNNISAIQRVLNYCPASGDGNEIRFRLNGSKLNGVIIDSAGSPTGYKDYSGSTVLQSNTWYLGTISWDGTNLKIYINGNENIPYTKSQDNNITMTDTVRNRRLGSSTGGSNIFSGIIDDIRIYNAVIPISQIKEQYYLGLNRLLVNGGINKEDYLSRLNNYASNN